EFLAAPSAVVRAGTSIRLEVRDEQHGPFTTQRTTILLVVMRLVRIDRPVPALFLGGHETSPSPSSSNGSGPTVISSTDSRRHVFFRTTVGSSYSASVMNSSSATNVYSPQISSPSARS